MRRAESETEFTHELQQGYTLALNIVIEFRSQPSYKARCEEILDHQEKQADLTV